MLHCTHIAIVDFLLDGCAGREGFPVAIEAETDGRDSMLRIGTEFGLCLATEKLYAHDYGPHEIKFKNVMLFEMPEETFSQALVRLFIERGVDAHK